MLAFSFRISVTVTPRSLALTHLQSFRDAPRAVTFEPCVLHKVFVERAGLPRTNGIQNAPERVTRLALLDTTPHPIRPQTVDLWKPIAETSDSATSNERAYQELIQMMHPDYREDPVMGQSIRNMVRRVGQHGLKNQLQAQINRPDCRETLLHIQAPTLLLSGRDNPACSLDIQLELLDALPFTALTLLKNCGHFSMLEQPKEITSTLQGWLDSA